MTPGVISPGDAARLLTKYHAALYGFVFACARSHHDTEDILQNVSMVVVESIAQLRDESGFLPWAREIARRSALAYFRKNRREHSVDPELVQRLAEAADVLEAERPTSVHGEALMACLERLPAQIRKLLALRYDGSFVDTEGLAARFGQSVQSVYAQVKRIKLALRECVERRLSAD